VVCSALAGATRGVRARAEGKYSGVRGTRPRVKFRVGVAPDQTRSLGGSGVFGV
jgi:hypothetical protein